MKSKKGYVQDFLFFGIFVFIFAIIILVGGKVNYDINENYQNTSASANAKAISGELANRYSGIMDYVYFGVFILFALSVLVSMFVLDTHPVLFFAVIVVFAFILIVIAIIGNSYEVFSDNDDLSGYVSSMPIMDWFMNNLVIVIMVLGFVGIVVLFAKLRAGVFQ